jgi:hypothetical protein
VAQILQLAHFTQQNGMAQMQIRRGGIETGFDAQGFAGFEARNQVVFEENFFCPTPNNRQGFVNSSHAFPPLLKLIAS